MSPKRRRSLSVGALAAAVWMTAGCGYLRIATGPKLGEVPSERDWIDRAGVEIADHHGAQRLRFLVVGDAGTGGGPDSAQSRVASRMHSSCEAAGGCDFALVTGDLVYPTGVRGDRDPKFASHFEEPYRRFGRFDFWMVTGNHDWYRRGSAAAEIRYSAHSERWRMPALDYAVPNLPSWLAIYGLDTTLLEAGRDTGQVARAAAALCDRAGWKIAFGHHGLYTAGYHGDRTGTIPAIEEALLDPLIRRCGVDLYFAGHDHVQAHLSSPDFTQITQGAGGRHLHRERDRSERAPGVELEAAFEEFGFALVEVEPASLRVTFHGLAAAESELYCARFERSLGGERPRAADCLD